jgi:isocitrate dehydrogenase
MSKEKQLIVIAEGDGIGPEIMAATLKILEAAGAEIETKKVVIGEKMYLQGQPSGIEAESWDLIRKAKVFLKSPITTPQGKGFKSLNVTVRTTLGLYANVRPCVAYMPFVESKHPGMDVVVIRENEEDLYTGIEYQQTSDVYHALKMITRPGSEKIIRYAFEYARSHHRKKVTCFTKDNILKMTDGLFHQLFDEISAEYPDIEKEHWIVDIGAAKLADTPLVFDIIVMPNLYGDILSDVAAQIAGSVGLAGSANIGEHVAMFEAIHGSAPRRAGQNLANPSGLLLAAVMMLVHIGQPKVAEKIHNAWLKTLEDGIHTYDIFKEKTSKVKVGTSEFADAVIERLGQKPQTLPEVHYQGAVNQSAVTQVRKKHREKKELVGVDVFVDWDDTIEQLEKRLLAMKGVPFNLTMISNRGARVWPQKAPETLCTNSWRCRFMTQKGTAERSHQSVIDLLQAMHGESLDFTEVQNLFSFDGKPGYTVSQEDQ